MSKECFNGTKDLSFIENVVRAFICIGYLKNLNSQSPGAFCRLQCKTDLSWRRDLCLEN